MDFPSLLVVYDRESRKVARCVTFAEDVAVCRAVMAAAEAAEAAKEAPQLFSDQRRAVCWRVVETWTLLENKSDGEDDGGYEKWRTRADALQRDLVDAWNTCRATRGSSPLSALPLVDWFADVCQNNFECRPLLTAAQVLAGCKGPNDSREAASLKKEI